MIHDTRLRGRLLMLPWGILEDHLGLYLRLIDRWAHPIAFCDLKGRCRHRGVFVNATLIFLRGAANHSLSEMPTVRSTCIGVDVRVRAVTPPWTVPCIEVVALLMCFRTSFPQHLAVWLRAAQHKAAPFLPLLLPCIVVAWTNQVSIINYCTLRCRWLLDHHHARVVGRQHLLLLLLCLHFCRDNLAKHFCRDDSGA